MALKLAVIAMLVCMTSASSYLRVQDHPDFAKHVEQLGLDDAGCSCSAKACSCCVEVKNTLQGQQMMFDAISDRFLALNVMQQAKTCFFFFCVDGF